MPQKIVAVDDVGSVCGQAVASTSFDDTPKLAARGVENPATKADVLKQYVEHFRWGRIIIIFSAWIIGAANGHSSDA